MNGGDIDFAKLKEQSQEMDGQKGFFVGFSKKNNFLSVSAKSVKKNDMQSKKLKKME